MTLPLPPTDPTGTTETAVGPAPLRIHLWSGPRNVSTALMYSFAQRDDTRVVDEPLYGHYLSVTGAEHPGREEVLASLDTDGSRVVETVLLGSSDRPVVFFKQMTHHLVGLDWAFLDHGVHVLLVRDPREVLASLVHQLPEPTLRDTGLDLQVRLLDHLRSRGQEPPVLDARELLLDPSSVLDKLCRRLGIPFQPAMLSWTAGARPEDGVWARHWYQGVHRSTGFRPYRPKTEPPPPHVQPLLERCLPLYQHLYRSALRATAPAADGT